MSHIQSRLQALLLLLLSLPEQLFLRRTAPAHASWLAASFTDLTRSRAELLAENALLRHQLQILQRQVKRPQLTRRDRFWLLILASRIAHWQQALLIILPDTLLRWHRQGFRLFWKRRSRAKTSTSKLGQETIDLIQRMAKENFLWGAERIQGERLKLGIAVAKRTVQKYMRPVRPPHASGQIWSTFLETHARDIWACDFLPVLDLRFRHAFLFFITELSSRRVVHFGVTRAPTAAWVAQQLREATPHDTTPCFLIRGGDRKFGSEFMSVAKISGIDVLRTPYRVPRANAVCERFLESVRCECLDHMMIVSEGQWYRVIKEYVEYFNRARPHQGIDQQIPEQMGTTGVKRREGKIISFPVLNGLQHDYRRVA